MVKIIHMLLFIILWKHLSTSSKEIALTLCSMTIDTACSSSLYAMHWAVKAIQSGDCDAAIVAGTNLILGPDTQILLSRLGALSPTSTCHTFDAAADGYARAEGFGALYLKKVGDAVDGQYPIRAVIRGTAVNS